VRRNLFILPLFKFIGFPMMLFFTGNVQPQTISQAESWAYQLQNISIDEIVDNSTFDLIVMDYSNDGTDGNKFTDAEISRINNSGKLAISYISIGEAENYRTYWNNNWDADNDGIPDSGAPDWLGSENPNWKGNYKVKYWNNEWKQIIFSYIDTILSQGFEGIYCDIIDAYYYWAEEVGANPNAAKDMITFVSEIREHVNQFNPNFLILPQNGEYIIWENSVSDSSKELYFQSIDAIGIEDVFFDGESDENNSFNPDTLRMEVLNEYQSKGKKVFSVEYLTNSDLIDIYISEAAAHNYIPYRTVRALDQLYDGIVTSADLFENSVVNEFKLYANYPNPFGGAIHSDNPTTVIKYSIPNNAGSDLARSQTSKSGRSNPPNFNSDKQISSVAPRPRNDGTVNVKLTVYDILGRKVATLVNEKLPPGNYSVIFNAGSFSGGLSSGVYFYRLTAGSKVKSKKMILLR